MPPVLRSRKFAPQAVSPAVRQQKPKPKRKAKQKPAGSTPTNKVEEQEVESPGESADQPIPHGQDVHQPLSSPFTQPLHVTVMPEAQGSGSDDDGKSTRSVPKREALFIPLL